ncbi:MAG: hypothetical protein D4R81_11025 [Nitrospiraceae bacterium]|nr:MAG: hypothetical protein D4R81_11025 [Nitrospiraceae bacterium]
MNAAVFFAAGFCFAVLQFCFFFLLESQLSSAWNSYAAVTHAWMAGILIGLMVSFETSRMRRAIWLVNLPCYYGVWLGLRAWPFDARALPLYALLVAGSGLFAGHFFRASFAQTKNARSLLLHENNGFVLGLLAGLLGFAANGRLFLLLAPALSFVLLFIFARLARCSL